MRTSKYDHQANLKNLEASEMRRLDPKFPRHVTSAVHFETLQVGEQSKQFITAPFLD